MITSLGFGGGARMGRTRARVVSFVNFTLALLLAVGFFYGTPVVTRAAPPAQSGTCAANADIVIMLDRTGSMSADELADERAAGYALLDFFSAKTPAPLIGVGAFPQQTGSNHAANAFIIHGLSNTESPPPYGDNTGGQDGDLYAAVDTGTADLPLTSFTNIASAIAVAQTELLAGSNSAKFLILISDGDPNRPTTSGPIEGDTVDQESAYDAADAAKLAGIEIFTIHYGSDVSGFAGPDMMAAIASGTYPPPSTDGHNTHGHQSGAEPNAAPGENTDGDNFFRAPTSDDLDDLVNAIADRICKKPQLTTQRNPSTSIAPGQNVYDVATLVGVASAGYPAGTVQFYICENPSNPPVLPACPQGSGTALGSPVVVVQDNPTTGHADSTNYSTYTVGGYCFRAEYTPTDPDYTSAIHFVVDNTECFTISGPTAVTLSSFDARVDTRSGPGIRLNWTTATEVNSAGFNVYRSESADGPYVRLNEHLIPTKADPLAGATYEYVDATVSPGQTYYYQLEDVELDGSSVRHPPIAVTAPAASLFGTTMLMGIGAVVGVVAVLGLSLILSRRRT